jgi:hypothetical protein
MEEDWSLETWLWTSSPCNADAGVTGLEPYGSSYERDFVSRMNEHRGKGGSVHEIGYYLPDLERIAVSCLAPPTALSVTAPDAWIGCQLPLIGDAYPDWLVRPPPASACSEACAESPSNRPLYCAGAQPHRDSGGDDAGLLINFALCRMQSQRDLPSRIQVFRQKLSVASEGIDKQCAPRDNPSPAFATSLPPLLSRLLQLPVFLCEPAISISIYPTQLTAGLQ